MKLLIKNGTVIDTVKKAESTADVLIADGLIAEVGRGIASAGAQVMDAAGKKVIPGLIDVHTHLREPGNEEEETIASGARAAAHGGVTTVFCMPNTLPPIDNAPSVEFILLKAQKEGCVNVFPIGCITKGSQGEELAEIGVLKRTGVVGISDDGNPVMNSQVMRRALQYAKMFDLPVIAHCEDRNLTRNGVMNAGYTSTVLGLRGIPRQGEEVMVSRDIMLAELTGGHLHIAHVSTAGSVELIRQAKKKNIRVTAETCPHYFTLTDDAVRQYETSTKMNPPLRSAADVAAIKAGLQDGTIDCIATDHAPHTEEEKNREFDLAPFGIIGLETMLGLVVTELIEPGLMSWPAAIAAMTAQPARVFNLEKRGVIAPGYHADITIVDPKKEYRFGPDDFLSKSRNSPFINRTLRGFPEMTIVGGTVAWSAAVKP